MLILMICQLVCFSVFINNLLRDRVMHTNLSSSYIFIDSCMRSLLARWIYSSARVSQIGTYKKIIFHDGTELCSILLTKSDQIVDSVVGVETGTNYTQVCAPMLKWEQVNLSPEYFCVKEDLMVTFQDNSKMMVQDSNDSPKDFDSSHLD